jgi:hypothetical protein
LAAVFLFVWRSYVSRYARMFLSASICGQSDGFSPKTGENDGQNVGAEQLLFGFVWQ